MKLPSGKLVENDEEIVSVFANHFSKVLNNHKPTNDDVIQEINLRNARLRKFTNLERVYTRYENVTKQQNPWPQQCSTKFL